MPKIGELESWVHDPDLQEWRDTLIQKGVDLGKIPVQFRSPKWGTFDNSQSPYLSARWVGEVVGVRPSSWTHSLTKDSTHKNLCVAGDER